SASGNSSSGTGSGDPNPTDESLAVTLGGSERFTPDAVARSMSASASSVVAGGTSGRKPEAGPVVTSSSPVVGSSGSMWRTAAAGSVIRGNSLNEPTSSGNWNSNDDPPPWYLLAGSPAAFGSGWSGVGCFGSLGFDMGAAPGGRTGAGPACEAAEAGRECVP